MNNATGTGVVIVGAGVAAGEAAMALRRNGYAESITLVGEESYLPYQRPPLSKAYLSGEVIAESLYFKAKAAYEKANISLVTGARVEHIERDTKRVALSDGRSIGYGNLILALGGRPRKLDATIQTASHEIHNLHTIRTIEDVDRLRIQCQPGRRAVIIGGGYIGLEVAAVAVKLGLHVCVLERMPRVLARVTAPEVSAFYEHVHRQAGVALRTHTEVSAVELAPDGKSICVVHCTDGSAILADVVIVGIGLVPNTELASAADLPVGDGILADRSARTADPDIFAIGDCSNHPCAPSGQSIRLESLPSAIEQARIAAGEICGKAMREPCVPWFWSDQYDLKLQIVGISRGYDRVVVRGAPESRRFSVLYMKEDRVISADAVNCPEEFSAARGLISRQVEVDPARIENSSLPLAALV